MNAPAPRKLFSVDSHVYVTSDHVKKHLASKYHSDWDEGIAIYDKRMADEWMAGGKLEMEDFVDMEAATHPGYSDSKARLAAMDADGVEVEVMYSELDFSSKVYSLGDKWRECATAYNNALAEFASVDPKRIFISYQIPLLDMDYAVSEIYRLADMGARSIQIPNFPSENGLPDYHESAYDPLWEAFSDTGIVVANHLTLKQTLWDVFRRDPTPQRGIFTSLPGFALAETLAWYILTGVCERYPKLKIVFVEPGLFWLSGYLRFLDERMEHHYEFPGMKELPTTYWKRQMAATFVSEAEAISDRHTLGVDNIMWSTDFPHPCCNWPNAGAKVEEFFAGVPEEEIHKITWANGAKMYGVE